MRIPVRRLDPALPLPAAQHAGDAGYRDEIRVILVNHDPTEAFKVEVGDRIAQLVIQEIAAIEWDEVEDLGQTARGQGGFGSTGRQ